MEVWTAQVGVRSRITNIFYVGSEGLMRDACGGRIGAA